MSLTHKHTHTHTISYTHQLLLNSALLCVYVWFFPRISFIFVYALRIFIGFDFSLSFLYLSLSLCQAAFACVWVSSSFPSLRYLSIDYLNLTTKLDISTANNKLGLFPFFNVWMNIFLKIFFVFLLLRFFISRFLAGDSQRVCEFRFMFVFLFLFFFFLFWA